MFKTIKLKYVWYVVLLIFPIVQKSTSVNDLIKFQNVNRYFLLIINSLLRGNVSLKLFEIRR